MLPPRFRLTSTNKSDLQAVCALGLEALLRVHGRIEAEEFTIERSRIERAIESEIGPIVAPALTRVLIGIAGTFRRTSMSAIEAVDGVSRAVAEQNDGSLPLSTWTECKPAILKLIETKSIKLAAKAVDISYDFERVYVTGRLLTSVRPIFNDPRDEIVGASVVQTLRVEYIGADGGQSSISIAVDLEDIRDLQEECRRAIVKADTSRTKISKDCGINVIIPGEDNR